MIEATKIEELVKKITDCMLQIDQICKADYKNMQLEELKQVDKKIDAYNELYTEYDKKIKMLEIEQAEKRKKERRDPFSSEISPSKKSIKNRFEVKNINQSDILSEYISNNGISHNTPLSRQELRENASNDQISWTKKLSKASNTIKMTGKHVLNKFNFFKKKSVASSIETNKPVYVPKNSRAIEINEEAIFREEAYDSNQSEPWEHSEDVIIVESPSHKREINRQNFFHRQQNPSIVNCLNSRIFSRKLERSIQF